MSFSEFIKSDDFKTEKHVPVIEIVKKDGDVYTIEIAVGKAVAHPNTTTHFINYISLFYKGNDEKFIKNLGKVEFLAHGESAEGADKGSAYTESCAVFKVKLTKPGKLVAVSYCNIHGLWESELAL